MIAPFLALRGCAVVEYHLHCQDMARFGYTQRRAEKSKRLEDAVRALGGWHPAAQPRKQAAEQLAEHTPAKRHP